MKKNSKQTYKEKKPTSHCIKKKKEVKGFEFKDWLFPVNQAGGEYITIPISNETRTVYITTPKGWKCKRKGCYSKIKHSHGVYPTLET